MAFRGLQAESAAQGEALMSVAKELRELVAEPFAQWAAGHKVYILSFQLGLKSERFVRNEFMGAKMPSLTDG